MIQDSGDFWAWFALATALWLCALGLRGALLELTAIRKLLEEVHRGRE